MSDIEVKISGQGTVRNESPTPDASVDASCSLCGESVEMVASVTPDGTGVYACKDCLRTRLEQMTLGAYLLKPKGTLPWGKITS